VSVENTVELESREKEWYTDAQGFRGLGWKAKADWHLKGKMEIAKSIEAYQVVAAQTAPARHKDAAIICGRQNGVLYPVRFWIVHAERPVFPLLRPAGLLPPEDSSPNP
jgi:hypothetical protein